MKTAVLISALLATMAFLTIPSAAADPPTTCAVEDYACFCTDTSGGTCNGIATSNCAASVGPTRGLMVGLVCTSIIGIGP